MRALLKNKSQLYREPLIFPRQPGCFIFNVLSERAEISRDGRLARDKDGIPRAALSRIENARDCTPSVSLTYNKLGDFRLLYCVFELF